MLMIVIPAFEKRVTYQIYIFPQICFCEFLHKRSLILTLKIKNYFYKTKQNKTKKLP